MRRTIRTVGSSGTAKLLARALRPAAYARPGQRARRNRQVPLLLTRSIRPAARPAPQCGRRCTTAHVGFYRQGRTGHRVRAGEHPKADRRREPSRHLARRLRQGMFGAAAVARYHPPFRTDATERAPRSLSVVSPPRPSPAIQGFIKKCNVSPDAYLQMALQLAYYRDAQAFALTYGAELAPGLRVLAALPPAPPSLTGMRQRATRTLPTGCWRHAQSRR